DNSTKYAGLGFDASVWEIFPYLIKGATLHILEDAIKYDVAKLNSYFETHDITIAFLPTQLCEHFIRLENSSLRFLLTGGDALKSIEATNYSLVNNYGPTENTVVTTSHIFTKDKTYSSLPIGKPIANTSVYILNKEGNLVPRGVIGELCIGGSGLSQGYINRAELTSEKFIVHPFKEGERLYRTGDLARWLEDGNLEFLGRIDSQVKLRGFRIELGEIENQVLGYPSIRDVVVNVVEQNQDKHLVGYYVSETSIDSSALRSFLQGKLPEYMLPSYYVHLDALPITVNGKVDRKNLPHPRLDIEDHYVGASNATEETLIKIWSDVLAIEENLISVERSFFELGGHSLKATVMVNQVYKELEVTINLKDVFEKPTIKEISDYIITMTQIGDEVLENGSDVIKITI
ncbi:non-ribosomal peptide synthetase, partial [Tenacibaculum agarivorans]|uniref:non-ribosomal peptide synthetase n=1 Tax=Tenacibaculum agarivorans TaxID=1908389 RepID=UPI000B143788